MKTLPFLLLLASLFTGCGTPKVWYQPGKTPAEAHQQLARCRVEAAKVNNPLAMLNGWFWLANEGNKGALIQDCMCGEGWLPTPRDSITNGTAYPEQ